MALEEARLMGKECGLVTDEECFLNVEIHCMSLFSYDDVDKELAELRADCIKNGIDCDGAIKKWNDNFNKQINQ